MDSPNGHVRLAGSVRPELPVLRLDRRRGDLWRAGIVSPLALLLSLLGPYLAGAGIVPLPGWLARLVVAVLAVGGGMLGVRIADGAVDDATSIDDQNLRVLLVFSGLLAVMVGGAFLFLSAMETLDQLW